MGLANMLKALLTAHHSAISHKADRDDIGIKFRNRVEAGLK